MVKEPTTRYPQTGDLKSLGDQEVIDLYDYYDISMRQYVHRRKIEALRKEIDRRTTNGTYKDEDMDKFFAENPWSPFNTLTH